MNRFLSITKIFTIAFCLFLSVQSVFGQYNFPVMYGTHFTTQASRFQPTKLGQGIGIFEANMGIYTAVGTNAINFGQALDLAGLDFGSRKNDLTKAKMNEIVNSFAGYNTASVSAYTTVNMFYKFRRKKDGEHHKELFSLSLEYAPRAEANITFSKEVARFFWYGNKQYANNPVNMGDVRVNMMASSEAVLGGAANIYSNDNFKLRLGLRLKYIIPIANVYTQRADATVQNVGTGFDQQTLITTRYEGSTSFPDAVSSSTFTKNQIGSGFGTDLGITAEFKNHIVATLSVLDVGQVRYDKNVKNYALSKNFVFDGISVTGNGQTGSVIDSLGTALKYTETAKAYTAPLPTRMILQGEYHIKKKDKDDREHTKHAFYFTYIQGFRNYGVATTRPVVNVGYSFNIKKIFNTGASFGFSGQSGFTAGLWLSTRFLGTTFGIGCDNLAPLISPNSANASTGLAFNLGMSF